MSHDLAKHKSYVTYTCQLVILNLRGSALAKAVGPLCVVAEKSSAVFFAPAMLAKKSPKPKAPKRPAGAGMKITKFKNGKIKAVISATPGLKVRENGSDKGFRAVRW